MKGFLSLWKGRTRRMAPPRRRMILESLERRLALASAALQVTDDVATTTEDQPVDIAVLENDSGPQLSVTSVTQGTGGEASINDDGTIHFVPEADFNGTATFEYQVTNRFGTDGTGSVEVTVTAANDAPVAEEDVGFVVPGDSITIDVLANDTDPEGDELTVTEVGDVSPVNAGVATLNADGTITFDADAAFEGEATFEYTVADSGGEEATGTVTVTISPDVATNQPPDAMDDTATVEEDGEVTIDVLANDADPEMGELTVIGVANAVGGEAVINDDDTITFTAEADFTGDASFEYTVRDNLGGEDTPAVTVSVTAVNDAPTLDLNGPDVDGVDFETRFIVGDDPVAVISPDLVLEDVDSAMLQSATITLAGILDAGEEILAVDTMGTAITAVYDAGTGVLTLTGPDTVENFAAVLATLTYENTADEPTTGERTIEIAVSDDTGETATAVSTVDVRETAALWNNVDDPADVNGDGMRNVADLLAVVRALKELGRGPLEEGVDPPPEEIGFVDVNADGSLTVTDLVAVARNMRSNGHGGGNGNGQGHGNVARFDDEGDDDDTPGQDVSNNRGNGIGRGLNNAIDTIAEDVARGRGRGRGRS